MTTAAGWGAMRVVALAGGVGGAKLAHGLALAGLGDRLSVVVNTADDFTLFGLHISPDLDTVMYTLAGLANPETGWGLRDDGFAALEMIRSYGRDPWFWVGDRDFATHILRSEALRLGERLTAVTRLLAASLGVEAAILPMTDSPVATMVRTPDGELDFQDYFVRRGHRDEVLGVRLEGIESARPTAEVDAAIDAADAIVLCPSNPIVSIGPILAVAGVRERLHASGVPVVAVSPIVGGQALKGPADRMLADLGQEVSAAGVATLFADLLDGMVVDTQDAALAPRIAALGLAVHVTDTVMRADDDRLRLARETLAFAGSLVERAGR
ncbi:MAG TPA: 2-phospho-L-lactate transferase [Thermomicrobiaceae bacterium]|nr:2-phospho-L-lactate transferase [Thermomicrobiaceae bacterium]